MKKKNWFLFGTAVLVIALLFSACPGSNDPGTVSYKVTVSKTTGGSLQVDPTGGPAGTYVEVRAYPEAGYKLDKLEVDGTPLEDAEPWGFTLNGNATVTANFVEVGEGIYTVSIDPALKNGHITAEPKNGTEGTEITLTIAPNAGYGLKEGSLQCSTADGTPVSISEDNTFNMPAAHVTVTAEFETKTAAQLIDVGTKALAAGNFDVAIDAFESAWQKDKTNREAIVYSSLGSLASIARDQNVRNLMSNRLGFTGYPGSIDKLITADWMNTLSLPLWFKDSGVYKDNLTGAGALQSSQWPLLFFANLVDKNQNGLNSLLDGILSSVFGSAFDNAAARSKDLSYDQPVELDAELVDAFGLTELFEGDNIYVGKAELDLLFSSLRIFKATLEWVAAYNWDTDVSFLMTDWAAIEDISALSPKNLPLGNNFMKDRNNGMMSKSKTDFVNALKTAVAVYDHLISANSKLPGAYKDELNKNGWLKSGLSQLGDAIEKGGIFYVSEQGPSGDTYDNSESSAIIGINMGNLFKAGQFAIDQLIETESGGKAPQFYAFNDSGAVAITNKGAFDALDEDEYVGFKFKLGNITAVVVKGLEGFLPEGDTMDIPLFPAHFGKELYGLYHK